MKTTKKVRFILKFSILIALIILIISGIRLNISNATIEWWDHPNWDDGTYPTKIETDNGLRWLAINRPEVFLAQTEYPLGYQRILGKTLKKVQNSADSPVDRKNGQCLQHNWTNKNGKDIYTVTDVFHINWNKEGYYNFWDKNIDNYDGYYHTSKEDLTIVKMAYCMNKLYNYPNDYLAGGSPEKYGFNNYWRDLITNNTITLSQYVQSCKSNDGYTEAGDYATDEEAEKYATEVSQYKKISKVNPTKASEINEIVLGPFKMEYGGKKVESVKINADGQDLVGNVIVCDKNGNGSSSIIPNNTEFYIKLVNGGSIYNFGNYEKVEVTFTQEKLKVYTCRMMILHADRFLQTEGIWAAEPGGENGYIQNSIKYEMKQPKAELIITKIDKDTKASLKGARFRVTGPNGFSGEYNSDTPIKNLKYGTYHIYEIQAPNTYSLTEQSGYNSTYKWVDLGTINLTSSNSKATFVASNEKYGYLTVNKTDAYERAKKLDMGFKIYSEKYKGWLKGDNGSYTYNNSEANADVYRTVNGTKTLNLLEFGTYQIYETEAPNGYNIEAQGGYNKGEFKNGKVFLGKTTLGVGNNKRKTENYNNEKIISISGYVWIDQPTGKENEYNSLYTDGETRVQGVTVNLIHKHTGAKKTTTSDANGEYIFKNAVTEWELGDYYVEFDYSNTKITTEAGTEPLKQYIPVAFNSENYDNIVSNGSRALALSIPTADKDLTGRATTYQGDADAYKAKETTYGLSGNIKKLYNKDNYTLEYINLGIKKIPDPQYHLQQDIDYVKVAMNGYTYTYRYGRKGNIDAKAAPQISFQAKTDNTVYTRAVYPEDIKYSQANGGDKLQMYVVYRIDISDTEENNIEELYQEQKLNIRSLTDTFDKERYELADKYDLDNNDEVRKDFDNWETTETANVLKYNGDKFNGGIAKGQTKTAYIQFKVKDGKLDELLSNPNGIKEKDYPTTATSVGYHDYKRKDYSWQNDITEEQSHITEDATRYGSAPWLMLKLGEQRAIKGKVFEDIATEESKSKGQKLGDGKYNDGEKAIPNVKVELLNIDKTKNDNDDVTKLPIATVYEKNAQNGYDGKSASTTTNANGEYTITGVVPGKYYLRFIYGDGSYKITDVNGNEIAGKLENQGIKAKEYKSTIVTQEKVADALKNRQNRDTNGLWYKDIGEDHSVAIDDLNYRQSNINDNNDSNISAIAGTARFDISVENTEGTGQSGEKTTGETQVSETGEISNSNLYKGLNFGVIKQPEQKIELDKYITNIKMVNAQNNVIFDGNPSVNEMTGVSAIDTSHGKVGSSFIRAELSEETIYGSTLTITYGIKLTNVSDINYYADNYYFYGDSTGAKEVTLSPKKVTDYIEQTTSNFKTLNPNTTISEGTVVKDGEYKGRIKFEITGWKVLYTNKNKNRTEDQTTSQTIEMTAERILSSSDNDMLIGNTALFIENGTITTDSEIIDRSVEPKDDGNKTKLQQTTINVIDVGNPKSAAITITPPTGEDKQSPVIYIIVGISALMILTTGIVLIKKKVL